MIFKLEHNLLVIDKDEVRGVKILRTILERDRGSEGDHDGRKKHQAFREFFYVYWVADFNSPGKLGGLNEKELHLQAIKEAELSKDWKLDSVVKEAVEWYKEYQLQMIPSLGLLNKTYEAMRLAERVIGLSMKALEGVIDLIEAPKEDGTQNLAELLLHTKTAAYQLDTINDIANKLPKTLKTLEELKERVTKEKGGSNLVRGGREKGTRADPK